MKLLNWTSGAYKPDFRVWRYNNTKDIERDHRRLRRCINKQLREMQKKGHLTFCIKYKVGNFKDPQYGNEYLKSLGFEVRWDGFRDRGIGNGCFFELTVIVPKEVYANGGV